MKEAIMHIIRPIKVLGVKSPYPTVVMDTKMHNDKSNLEIDKEVFGLKNRFHNI